MVERRVDMLTQLFYFCCLVLWAGAEELPVKKPQITSLHITSDIQFRYATTTVVSTMKNPSTDAREAIFDVQLPNEAFISNLTLEIDGKTVVGQVKEKEEAKAQYQAAKRSGQSAGYIGTKQREMNRFNLAVNVAGQGKVEFRLTYQELLKRKHGHYEQVIYINPGQPVEDMSVRVEILEYRDITKLQVPRLRNDIDTDSGTDISSITDISYMSKNQATVVFIPSVEYQRKQSDNGMAGQFVVHYDVERASDAGDILLVNGYFVHFFAPTGLGRLPNDVLFILDTSGSMSGEKMLQLKQAMKSILGQLMEGDRFNIMQFSGDISFWRTEMAEVADEDAREEAKNYIMNLKADGWTNIELSLRQGLKFLANSSDVGNHARSPILVFLTDGEATKGVLDTNKILESVKTTNEAKIPIFSLAFGDYADYALVKKVAIQNNGFGRKIYAASDAALQISGFYNEIAVTLMSNISFHYLDAPVENVTKHEYNNYFNGSEMVVAGRFSSSDEILLLQDILKITITGTTSKGVKELNPSKDNILNEIILGNVTATLDFEMMTEKVWAYLTIKQLLDQIVGSMDETEKEKIRQKALELSLKYKFVTPLTSMVVTRDQDVTDYDYLQPTTTLRPPPTFAPMFDDYDSQMMGFPQSIPAQFSQSSFLRFDAQAGRAAPNLANLAIFRPQRMRHTYPNAGNVNRLNSQTARRVQPSTVSAIATSTTQMTTIMPKPKSKRKFPLIIYYPHRSLLSSGICFTLKYNGVTQGRYLAYEDGAVNVYLQLVQKGRKVVIDKLTLTETSTNYTDVIDRKFIVSKKKTTDVNGQSLWSIQYFKNEHFGSLSVGALRLKVTPSSKSSTGIYVEVYEERNKHAYPAGIFGTILDKDIALRKNGKRVYLKVDSNTLKTTLKRADTVSSLACWNLKKGESKVLNMTMFFGP